MNLRKSFLLFLFIGISKSAVAGYDSNIDGKITKLVTYAYNNQILIRLENQPASHPACNHTYFSINSDVKTENRQQMLSRLMVAFASGQVVRLGYDGAGDCSHSYIRVHRAG